MGFALLETNIEIVVALRTGLGHIDPLHAGRCSADHKDHGRSPSPHVLPAHGSQRPNLMIDELEFVANVRSWEESTFGFRKPIDLSANKTKPREQ